jgi:hypothetical protein
LGEQYAGTARNKVSDEQFQQVGSHVYEMQDEKKYL